MQELILTVRADLITEAGIAHGGSLIFSASMLAQLDMYDSIESRSILGPRVSNRKVLGIDIDIRENNRLTIEAHPLASAFKCYKALVSTSNCSSRCALLHPHTNGSSCV